MIFRLSLAKLTGSWLMICLGLASVSQAGERPQWVVSSVSKGISVSQFFSRSLPGITVEKIFGPKQRFALVRGDRKNLEAHLSGVKIQPNFPYELLDSADPDFEKSWGLHNYGQAVDTLTPGLVGRDVGAVGAWGIFTGSPSVVVAIIDSGIDFSHEELRDNLWINSSEIPNNGIDDDNNGFTDDWWGWNFGEGNNDPRDTNGHGSFCAGIVGAKAGNQKGARGVNWQVKLMALKFLDSDGGGSTESAISSIVYAVENGASVINASWGGNSFDQALYDTVKWAGDRGVLFVAAAGNSGRNNDIDLNPMYPASFRLPKMLTVAAYDNRDELADFSNYGKETVHIGAPGVSIYSTQLGGYDFGDGTSFAAPFVSGAAALVKGFDPSLTMTAIRERLINTSEVIDYYEKEKIQSAGRVHLFNALRKIEPIRPVAPTVWKEINTHYETAHPYPIDFKDSFEVSYPGANHIRVRFRDFATEGCCDAVRLIDKQGREVAVYRGKLGTFWSADALGDRLRVEFTSDYSISEWGFRVDAYDVSFEESLWSLLNPVHWLPNETKEAFAPIIPLFRF